MIMLNKWTVFCVVNLRLVIGAYGSKRGFLFLFFLFKQYLKQLLQKQ